MPYERVLVLANETVAGQNLHRQISELTADGGAVMVVAPALSSRLKFAFSDVDKPRAEAQQRLDDSLALMERSGIKATGEIGDPDPVRAFQDAVAVFEPNAVVISTHPPGRSNWLEAKVVDRIRDRTELPVTHVVVDLSAEPATEHLQSA